MKTADDIKREEYEQLQNIYLSCRGMLRYNGVDKDAFNLTYKDMYDATHRLTDWYNDPDNDIDDE